MRIRRLRIEGFRSVSSLEMELPQVCAFVGPNNSGKSNILTAIASVLGRDWVSRTTFAEDDVTWREPDGDILIEVELDPPASYRPFKNSRPIDVPILRFVWTTYKVGPQKGERRLEQRALNSHGDPIQVPQNAPKKGVKPKFAPLTNIPDVIRQQVPVIHIGTDRSLSRQLPSARYSMLRQLFDDVLVEFSDPQNTVELAEPDGNTRRVPRSEHFDATLQAALDLLRTSGFIDIERSIKRHALEQLGLDANSDSLDLEFGPLTAENFYRALDLTVREAEFSISATRLGHGVQNALVLAILRVFEERKKQGAILLIEEPEMFLHPQLQRALYKTLRSVGDSNQVLYVTHSPHFVRIPEYDEVARVSRDPSGTTVRRSDLPRTPSLEEKTRKELDPERNELFFAARIVLVEGDTEKLAIPEYAERLGVDLDLEGASVVEVGGKRNLPAFLDIAESFGIPTGVLYDTDSSEFSGRRDEEAEFNAALESRARPGSLTRVWPLEPNFETHLRSELGEAEYQRLCQEHSGVSKAVRARLIAADTATAIPDPVPKVIRWLTAQGGEAADDEGRGVRPGGAPHERPSS